MALPRGVRTGFIGIPGPRSRRRVEPRAGYGEAEPGHLAAQYAEAVRRHDEAVAELRRVSDAMAAALQRQGERKPQAGAPAPYEVETEPDETRGALEAPAGSDDAPAATGARRTRRRSAESSGDRPDPDRPANLRCERNSETGSICLSWDAAAREGLIFGVWRSVTPREGPAGAFERIAMVRETGFIDGEAPADARRISYAVRALDGRRPVPGSAHVCVALDG